MADNKIKVSPYGTWKSPLSSAQVCQSGISFQEIHCDPMNQEKVYWSELHPDEDGCVIVFSRSIHDSESRRWTPTGYSCRSRVHEYGGGAFFVHKETLFFVNDKDQQYYTQSAPGSSPCLVTPGTKGHRYADGQLCPSGDRFVCILEDHTCAEEGEPKNTIVLVIHAEHKQLILVSGADFYSSPRVSPDGQKLLWMEWNHPNMPWDDTKVVVANLLAEAIDSTSICYVSNTPGLNAQHPRWGLDGSLFYINDETNWWNIYSWDKQSGKSTNLWPREFDFGHPPWQFGHSYFDIHPSGCSIVCKWEKSILIIDLASDKHRELSVGDNVIGDLLFCPGGEYVYAVAHNSTSPSSVIAISLATELISPLAIAGSLTIDQGYLSKPGRISFPTDDGAAVAFGNYYPPKNKDYKGPPGSCPPLLVRVHGGPTSQASLALDLGKQYFTSRGFAILDVDHRGSTGYGKKFRQALYGKWGEVDIEDCCNGALYLAKEMRLVNPEGLFIDGGSAGGYTTLACLTFRSVFKAGVSHFGISDLELLAKETHKFESRYCDQLIAAYPKERRVFIERSPLHHVHKLNAPAAFFHGNLDKVVLPNQAKLMYDAIKAKKLPCAFVLFPDEYHGFVKSENKQKALDGEFYFLARILGVKPADQGIEIPIENLED